MDILQYMISVLESLIQEPLSPAQKRAVAADLKDMSLAFDRRIMSQMKDYAMQKGLTK